MLGQPGRDRGGFQDRKAAVVESDHFGQQFSPKPVPIATDAIDLKLLGHHATAASGGTVAVLGLVELLELSVVAADVEVLSAVADPVEALPAYDAAAT